MLVTTGVGSPTLKATALLVPKRVVSVMLCAPVLALLAIEKLNVTCVGVTDWTVRVIPEPVIADVVVCVNKSSKLEPCTLIVPDVLIEPELGFMLEIEGTPVGRLT